MDAAIADVGEHPLGYNLFAYCANNPVNMSDDSGYWPSWASLSSKGWNVSSAESRVMIGNGKYRYPDIIATKNGMTRYYQIGRRTATGRPVARELRALRDLGRQSAAVYFIPYN